MKANELRKLSEKWGVDLQRFENLAFSLKIKYGESSEKEARKISKALERRGYRRKGCDYQYRDVAIYTFEDGTYMFANRIMPDMDSFQWSNIRDICGEQIIDKNLFFGFVYGSLFGILLSIFIAW